MSAVELTVIMKNEERTQRQKFLIYEKIALVASDPIIAKCLAEAYKNFNGSVEDVTIRTTMVLQ